MNEDTCTNFWGDKDTSISFCEQKYDQVFWIAEYYNTLSSFSYIIACLLYSPTINYILHFIFIISEYFGGKYFCLIIFLFLILCRSLRDSAINQVNENIIDTLKYLF